MMPGLSERGLPVVRRRGELAGVKIPMLSAKGRDTDIAIMPDAGADAFMTSPSTKVNWLRRCASCSLMKDRQARDCRVAAARAALALWAIGGWAAFSATPDAAGSCAALAAMLQEQVARSCSGGLLAGVLGWRAARGSSALVFVCGLRPEGPWFAADVEREIEPAGSAETRVPS